MSEPGRMRTALITGAGQGIGRACALALLRDYPRLVLLDRNEATLEETAQAAADKGATVLSGKVDVTDFEAATQAAAQAEKRFGSLDALVNNAGFDRPGTTDKIGLEDFEAVLRVHLTAALNLIQAVLPGMRQRGWGRIVNVSSVYGLIGAKGEVAYSAAKAGLIGLTKSVAREAGRAGVTVNAVCPGLTRTPTIETVMAPSHREAIIAETPLGRLAEAEEVAEVVAFLASDKAAFVTGAVWPVSGGWGV